MGEVRVRASERVLRVVLRQAQDAGMTAAGDEWDGVTRIYDPEGVERDGVWLGEWFGVDVQLRRADAEAGERYVVRCTELRTKDGEATQVVFLRDVENQPLTGGGVVRWWPGAPGMDPWPGDCVASRYYGNGVIGVTDGPLGDVGFGMGGGDCPPGSSAVWVAHCEGRSDLVEKLGWGVGENHRVVWPVFQVMEVGEDPEPPVPGDDELVEAVREVAYEVRMLRGVLERDLVVSRQ